MNKRTLLGATALRSFAAIGLTAGMFSPALAQEVPADEDPPAVLDSEQEAESGEAAAPGTEEIVVTGSRIRRPNLDSALPVTSVGGEEFFETGTVSIGDVLNDLPALRSTFSQANSTRGLGIAGLNLLDLRGLGISRTLVLQNGRRHVGGDVLLTGVAVDVNSIPTDLIERVDIVTGGNSAVYGSDAIAGVVNFVLKRDYEGFLVRGQGGLSRYEDAGAYFVSGLWGKNLFGDRANIAINAEYARQDEAFAAERPNFRRVFTVVDNDVPCNAGSTTAPVGCQTNIVNGGDGVPDRVINPDFRSTTVSNTGSIGFNTRQCGVDPRGGIVNASFYSCRFIFTPEGNLVPLTGTRTGIGPNGQMIGGNGEGFFSGRQLQIYPNNDRFNVNLMSHFEIVPALEPFIEAKFSRSDSIGNSQSGPSFITGATLADPFQFVGGYNREAFSINNPFLTDQARAEICAQRAQNRTATGVLSPLPCNANTRISITRYLTGVGPRQEQITRDTYRIVGGLRGDIGGPWNYEVALNYGRTDERNRITNDLDIQRFLLAADAVVDPASGNIVCRSQIDPNAAFGYYPFLYGTDPNAQARLDADVAACVPLNFIGSQNFGAAGDYIRSNRDANGKVSQFNAVAFVSGDSSQFFELPGGPIGVVVGAEYREDDLFYNQDEDITLGYTFYNAIPTFEAPKSKVKEAFGEIRVPILRDVPFFQELEVSAAGRVSDYNIGNTGTVYAYNASAMWSPIRGLRLRGNYARAVRAPNQVELFTPLGQNFALPADPCDVSQVGAGSPNRAANCAAAGIPAGTTIQYPTSISGFQGGFEELEAETSDSYTLGGVFTPTFLPGFSLSADYYDIAVDKAITTPTVQNILNACYDLPQPNQFCNLFQRAGPNGGNTPGNQPFGVLNNTFQQTPQNFAALKARGMDVELAYRGQIGNIGRLDTRFTYTHVFELTQNIDPANPEIGDRLLSEVGDPEDAFNWSTSIERGRFTAGYQMRYLGRQIISAGALGEYEDFFSFEGRPPENADFADVTWYDPRFYHDIRFSVDVTPRYNMYLGVDNLTNIMPQYAATGLGQGTAIYDVRGRFLYAGFSAKF